MATGASQSRPEGWFPTETNSERGWRLDIVSLLAVIGESAMAEHSQAMTASWLGVLPRIIPAPQVLLKPTRPTRLPQVNAIVVGVENGVQIETLNYFPNILHPIEDLNPFAFRFYHIKHSPKQRQTLGDQKTREDTTATLPAPVSTSSKPGNISTNITRRPRRTGTMHSFVSMTRQITHSNENKFPPHVPINKLSPLNILSLLSFALTLGLFAWSIANRDGVACLAIVTVSSASSIVGFASKWKPQLMKRNSSANVPRGDVVIRTREGAFIVAKCDENVARELYSGTEECKYNVENVMLYRTLVGIGTFLLMVSVVLLGNCNFTLQVAIGVSYILLNGLFWGAALINKRHLWDLSSIYELHDLTSDDGKNADKGDTHDQDPEMRPSFTRTMWYAMRATGDVGWVRRSGAAPSTDEWDKWLKQAEDEIKKGNNDWRAVEAKDNIVGQTDQTGPEASSPLSAATINGITIPGGQQAPAIQVPPEKTR